MDKFKNKYCIPSARLQNWDYSNKGAYFITICTARREHYFGDIHNGIMYPNKIGTLAERYWIDISNHFSFIELGNFVIMPNHMHGILIINKRHKFSLGKDAINRVSTSLKIEIPNESKIGGITGDANPMFHQNISRIIRRYKGCCTYEMRKTHADFGWQPRFYDHIIRNNNSFNKIQNYISKNPLNWAKDEFYSQ